MQEIGGFSALGIGVHRVMHPRLFAAVVTASQCAVIWADSFDPLKVAPVTVAAIPAVALGELPGNRERVTAAAEPFKVEPIPLVVEPMDVEFHGVQSPCSK